MSGSGVSKNATVSDVTAPCRRSSDDGCSSRRHSRGWVTLIAGTRTRSEGPLLGCEAESVKFAVENASGPLFAFDDVVDLDTAEELRCARRGGVPGRLDPVQEPKRIVRVSDRVDTKPGQ